MMKSGCIKDVLSESDYNHAWIVGNVMSEVLERLLLTRLLTEVSGVNMFTARKVISCCITSMIKGIQYRFSIVSTIFPYQKSKHLT